MTSAHDARRMRRIPFDDRAVLVGERRGGDDADGATDAR
jgi:hypothetical protein